MTGANLPWVHYGIDFGANAWRPEGGVSQPEELAMLDITFARLAASGMSWIRWFLFCDGRAGIRFTPGGRPAGIDDHLFRDVDAAVESAQRHGIRIMFVLLDFLWCDPASIVRGVQLGGRSQVLADPEHRNALLDTVLKPVLERYGAEPAVFAWDIINEPEWIKTVEWIEVRTFIDDTARLVHSLTSHPVTVGSAGVRWRENYLSLGLDFYQVHWYDNLERQTDWRRRCRCWASIVQCCSVNFRHGDRVGRSITSSARRERPVTRVRFTGPCCRTTKAARDEVIRQTRVLHPHHYHRA